MSLEAEIKNLCIAMTRLAEGVEKLLTLGHAPSEKQQWLDPPPGTAAPQSVVAPPKTETVTIRNDEPLPGGAMETPPIQVNTALTLDDIKKALMGTAAKFDVATGTAKSKAILACFGAQKLSQVAPENYAEFIELCQSVAAGGEV